jgi:hypothetical protein
MPRRVLDLFSSWAICWVVVKLSKFGSRLPLCVMWGLWRERNVRHFEDVEMPVLELRRNMLNTLFVWASAYIARVVLRLQSF